MQTSPGEPAILDLRSLFSTRPGLSGSEGGRCAECASLSFERVNRPLPTDLVIRSKSDDICKIDGPEITPVIRRTFEERTSTEYGAIGVAVLVSEYIEQLTVFECSRIDGGGFDYYMIPTAAVEIPVDDNFFARATAVMEVSGILRGSEADIEKRLQEKLARWKNVVPALPAFVVVVEFSRGIVRLNWL